MTDAEMIAELERLNAARTRAEWRWREEFVEEDGRTLRTLSPGVLIIDDMGGGPWGDDIDKTNAHFIVAAANAMPRLLALAKEAQAARAEAERLREALEPFAREASAWAKLADDDRLVVCDPEDPSCCSPYDLRVSYFRKAALAQEQRDE